jgi:carboxymethylenebutenolidase
MHTETICLRSRDGVSVSAFRATPSGPVHAGLVVIQEIFGVIAHIRAVCEQYAQLGYAVIAPAFFDRVRPGVELAYTEADFAEGRQLVGEIGFDAALRDVRAAADLLAPNGRVGVVGYCWGGTAAFLCATRLGLPAVSYYGARTVPFLHEHPQAPLLFHFGEKDTSIPPESVNAIRQALPKAKVHVYPTGHAFNRHGHKDCHVTSAEIALQRSLDFLELHLHA